MSRTTSNPRPRSQSPANTSRDLTRLLSRLQKTVLSPEGDHALRRSNFLRSKVGFNIEHARSLLIKLEHNGQSTPPSRPSSTDPDLQQKRAVLKRLQDRLFELNQIDDNDDDDDDSHSDDENVQNLLSRYAPVVETNDISHVPANGPQPAAASASGVLESTLLSRRGRSTGTGTGTATTSARSGAAQPIVTSPFAPKPSASIANPSKSSETETLLSHHTSEQESITDSLLALATALKESTLSFSQSIEASNPLVDRATSSLDRNVGGMQAAEKRMGMLRRMTEGRGWWSRLGLYGWIAVLWVALILIMFVMPKLRF